MSRTRITWLAFGAFLAVALAAMGWLTMTVVRLERAEVHAARQALTEENVRLALWRMDSAMGPLIAVESTRPVSAYTVFGAVDSGSTSPFGRQEGLPLSGPLEPSLHILLHFQVEPDGRITSPQVPAAGVQSGALPGGTQKPSTVEARGRLEQLETFLKPAYLLELLPEDLQTWPEQVEIVTVLDQVGLPPPPVLPESQNPRAIDITKRQIDKNILEQQARFSQAVSNWRAGDQRPAGATARRQEPRQGPMHPVWIGDSLLLARRVTTGNQVYVQGCWLDWPAIRAELLANVVELLPAAVLKPAASPVTVPAVRMLASLPVELVPGAVPADPIEGRSPLLLSLLFAWACTLLAAAAVAVLLVGVLSLSERRAAFVSAVTHELRTPLTTFRLYSEMLADGLVADEGKRRSYLETLRSEAERLCHLVENVLAYARLEGRGAPGPVEAVTGEELVARWRDRLAARAEAAGMELVTDLDEAALTAWFRLNVSAIEQILFNLVDNACKYAAAAGDRRIHVRITEAGGRLVIRVSDHGPGIARKDARRLFRPFFKSAREAARTAPGVGLGLALSRQLARSMKGDLRLDHDMSGGASFVLTVPRGK